MIPIDYSVSISRVLYADVKSLQSRILSAYNRAHNPIRIEGGGMLGIIVTLLAVLAVICFAFHYSDHPSSRGLKSDVLFYLAPKYFNQKAGTTDRKNREDSPQILNRQS
jgi:hypothetical protein